MYFLYFGGLNRFILNDSKKCENSSILKILRFIVDDVSDEYNADKR